LRSSCEEISFGKLSAPLGGSALESTCCQVVVDSAGASGDYVFLGVSSTFKAVVGWRKDILGKRVAEVVAEIEKSNLDWIGGCAQVALQGDALHPYTQEVLYANRWHQKMFGKSSRRASVIRSFSPVHSAPIALFGKTSLALALPHYRLDHSLVRWLWCSP